MQITMTFGGGGLVWVCFKNIEFFCVEHHSYKEKR